MLRRTGERFDLTVRLIVCGQYSDYLREYLSDEGSSGETRAGQTGGWSYNQRKEDKVPSPKSEFVMVFFPWDYIHYTRKVFSHVSIKKRYDD